MNMNPLKKRMKEDSKLNRENKRKQYEKGYYKTHPCNETFTCKNCGRVVVPAGAGSDHRNHCPNCLGKPDSFYPACCSLIKWFKWYTGLQ